MALSQFDKCLRPINLAPPLTKGRLGGVQFIALKNLFGLKEWIQAF
jgi:hypothetical protein